MTNCGQKFGDRARITLTAVQTYIRRPVPNALRELPSLQQLIVGDITLSQIADGKPQALNQELGAQRAQVCFKTYNKAIKDLKRADIIRPTLDYIPGIRATHYEVNPDTYQDGYHWAEFLIDKREFRSNSERLQTDQTRAQAKDFKRLSVNVNQAALKFIARKVTTEGLELGTTVKDKESQTWSTWLPELLPTAPPFTLIEIEFRIREAEHISLDHYIFQNPTTERIYSTLTGLPREFRAELLYKASKDQERTPLAEIDIANSQPLLLAATMKRNGIQCSDLLSVCAEGKFHQAVMEATGQTDKNEHKKKLFRYIYGQTFDKGRAQYQEAIRELFGSPVADYIEAHKRKHGYKALPIAMMQTEARAVIQKAIPSFKAIRPNEPCFSVHDALLVPSQGENIEIASEALKTAFIDLCGIEPTINAKQ